MKKIRWSLIVLASLFLLLTILNYFGYFLKINGLTHGWFVSIRSEELNKVFLFITWLGDKFFVALVIILLMFYTWQQKKFSWKFDAVFEPIVLGSMAIAGVLLGTIIKHSLALARPLNSVGEWTGFTFPSGHATLSTLMTGLLWLFVFSNYTQKKWRRLAGIICLLLPFLVGISRLYLGAHWPSDILGGWLLGVSLVLLSAIIKDQFKNLSSYN